MCYHTLRCQDMNISNWIKIPTRAQKCFYIENKISTQCVCLSLDIFIYPLFIVIIIIVIIIIIIIVNIYSALFTFWDKLIGYTHIHISFWPSWIGSQVEVFACTFLEGLQGQLADSQWITRVIGSPQSRVVPRWNGFFMALNWVLLTTY